MASAARDQRPPVDLATFLAELPPDAAGDARAAAHRMDELERSIDPIRDIEARYAWAAWLALAFFIAGAIIVLWPGEWAAAVFAVIGRLGVVAMLSGLPLLGFAYGMATRDRSRVDLNKIVLNRKHFLPHGAYYFPPEDPRGEGRVVFIEVRPEPKRRYTRHDHVRPGQLW